MSVDGPAPAEESAAAVSADRCPLCGGGNACAMAAGDASPCWCVTAVFDDALLARVRLAARGRACICAACAAAGRRAR
jgi:hypothetical protein